MSAALSLRAFVALVSSLAGPSSHFCTYVVYKRVCRKTSPNAGLHKLYEGVLKKLIVRRLLTVSASDCCGREDVISNRDDCFSPIQARRATASKKPTRVANTECSGGIVG